MEDQASRLRALVGDKREYNGYQPPSPETGADEPPEVAAADPETGYHSAPPPLPLEPSLAAKAAQAFPAAPTAPAVPVAAVATEEDITDVTAPMRDNSARIIAITSGKGGVGKTNLTINLAIALAATGQRIIVIDADLGMANVDVALGTTSRNSLSALVRDDVTLADIVTHGPHGVDYISGGSGLEHVADFSPAQRKIFWQKIAACDEIADIILLDTGAGIGKNVLDFILSADEVILVTTPEPTALTDAYAMMKAYSRYAVEKNLHLVVNRVYDEVDSREVITKLRRTAERFLNLEFDVAGYIYEDRNVMDAIRRQTPLLVAHRDTVAARCIQSIAENILYGRKTNVKRGWREFITRFLRFSS